MIFDIWVFFEKSVEKREVRLKSNKNNGSFTWWHIYSYASYLAEFVLAWEMFHTKVVEKIKTYIVRSTIFFPPKIVPLWDNMEKYCTARQTTDDTMTHALCMLDNYGYRHALWVSNTYCFSTVTMVMRTRLVTLIRTLSVLFTSTLDGSVLLAVRPGSLYPQGNSPQYPSNSFSVQKRSSPMWYDAITTLNHLPIYRVSYPTRLESWSAPLQWPQPSHFFNPLKPSGNFTYDQV
jgi:hypothetical protein